MELKHDKVLELFNQKFDGNYNAFARALDLSPGNLYNYLTTGKNAGIVTLSAIVKYLKDNNISIIDYLDL